MTLTTARRPCWATIWRPSWAWDEGEAPVYALLPGDYKGNMVIVFQNGKAARFALESFETKTNRRRLTGAYSAKSPAVAFFFPVDEETEITMFSTANRALTFRANMLDIKASRATQGVQAMVLRGKHTVTRACRMGEGGAVRQRAVPLPQHPVDRRAADRRRPAGKADEAGNEK